MSHINKYKSHTILLVFFLLFFSCGEKHIVSMELFATLKDGGKIHVDLEIEVQDAAHLDLVRSKEEKIKQAFYFTMSEKSSNFIFAKGKRELVSIISHILDITLAPLSVNGNITNFKLILED